MEELTQSSSPTEQGDKGEGGGEGGAGGGLAMATKGTVKDADPESPSAWSSEKESTVQPDTVSSAPFQPSPYESAMSRVQLAPGDNFFV